MKKYISILLIIFIFLLTNITTITVFAEDLEENELELIEIENSDSDNEIDASFGDENVALTNGIGAGSGNYDQVNSVFLENYVSYYFLQLKDNFGENKVETCSYVAAAMLLSYYDTYWDDNIISENYDQPTNLFNRNNQIANNLRSPGIKREGYSELNGKTYETAIADHSSTHFHLELLRIGTVELGLSYAIAPWDIVDLLEHYLYVKKGYTPSQVSIDYIGWDDPEDLLVNKKDYIIDKVEQGIPVIVSGGEIAVDGFAHTYIIYDYDEANDELYCHMGWHYAINSDGQPDTTHIAFSSIEGTLIGGAITLDFNIPHSHSNNYVDSEENTYCSCYFSCHPEHEHEYEACVGAESTHHVYKCGCAAEEDSAFLHNFECDGTESGVHYEKCADCGYRGNQFTVGEYSNITSTQHTQTCISCGHTETHSHNLRCEKINNTYHRKYCIECGYVKATEEHNYTYSYTPTFANRHKKTCACGASVSEFCVGHASIGGVSYCAYCGQEITKIIDPLSEDEEDALLMTKKEDEDYY